MANENIQVGGSKVRGSEVDRLKKAAQTRSINAARKEKLSDRNRYAHSKLTKCANACQQLADAILDGSEANGDVLNACAMLEANIGQCLFQ